MTRENRDKGAVVFSFARTTTVRWRVFSQYRNNMSGASVLQINGVLKHISEHILGEKYTVQWQNNGLKFTSSA